MDIILHLKNCHKKELPATRLQQDINNLLEDLRALVFHEENEEEGFQNSYEIDVDLVLSTQRSLAHRQKMLKQSKIHAHLSAVERPYKELKNGGRVFSKNREKAYSKVSNEHFLGSFVRIFGF